MGTLELVLFRPVVIVLEPDTLLIVAEGVVVGLLRKLPGQLKTSSRLIARPRAPPCRARIDYALQARLLRDLLLIIAGTLLFLAVRNLLTIPRMALRPKHGRNRCILPKELLMRIRYRSGA